MMERNSLLRFSLICTLFIFCIAFLPFVSAFTFTKVADQFESSSCVVDEGVGTCTTFDASNFNDDNPATNAENFCEDSGGSKTCTYTTYWNTSASALGARHIIQQIVYQDQFTTSCSISTFIYNFTSSSYLILDTTTTCTGVTITWNSTPFSDLFTDFLDGNGFAKFKTSFQYSGTDADLAIFPKEGDCFFLNYTSCFPPASGDWLIEDNCTLTSPETITGTLNISSGSSLNLSAALTILGDYIYMWNPSFLRLSSGGQISG